jgi:disulfide bond formation protein DsbB
MDRKTTLIAFLIVSMLTISGAWIFQWLGYAPCPLCLKQRWAWYAAAALAALLYFAAPSSRWGLAALALVMAGSAAFGAYHAGVEWKFWPGPDTCGGDLAGGLPTLTNDPVVRCDEPALLVFGLSLAAWNAVISAALAAFVFRAARV